MNKKERKSTMVELVQELRLLPDVPGRDEIIAEALAGEFHDYKNKKYICGKVAVVGKLITAGFHGLAKRVTQGEFDEEADEEDKAYLRKSALEGGFNEEQVKTLFKL